MFCTNCGEENEDNAKFCKKCGSPLEPIENEDSKENYKISTNKKPINTEDNKSNKAIQHNSTFIVIVGIIAFILLIIGILIMTNSFDETQIYNEKMTIFYNDLDEIHKIDQISNADNDEAISICDNSIKLCDNDTKVLMELNSSISNDTRKEYITLCIDHLKCTSDLYKNLKETFETSKKFHNNEITGNEAIRIMEDSGQELHNSVGPALININAKIKDYEEKYPFVLINGTKSIYNKLKLIDSNITTNNYDNYNEYNNYDNTNNNDNYDNYDDYDDYEDTQQESNNKWTFDRGVADQPTA